MNKYFSCAVFAAVLLLSGCMSFTYDGKTGPISGKAVKVLKSDSVSQNFTILGKAEVSGNYQNVSRDRMIERLKSEAAARGADAVVITEQLVIPVGTPYDAAGKNIAGADYDDTNRSWSELYRDVNQTIGNIGEKTAPAAASSASYRRVIRAVFVKDTSTGGQGAERK